MKTAAQQAQKSKAVATEIPDRCTAAVFEGPNRPLALREVDVPTELGPGEILCRVRMSTICGSDLHTVFGRRPEPVPSILGHEIVGEIVDHHAHDLRDSNGMPLSRSDRVTWSIAASCLACRYCRTGMPQKCVRLRKYGHLPLNEPPHITGGYCEYVCLMPGTALFKVPPGLSDEVITPANCTLATAQNAVERVALSQKDTVLIQGAGLLGLYLCGLAGSEGCACIIVTDPDPERLQMARRFGAHHCLCVDDRERAELVRRVRACCPNGSLTVSFEACGAREAPGIAADALDIGGRILLAGLVTPMSLLDIDANQVIRKYLTIAGIHNYEPAHLRKAVDFLRTHRTIYPFEQIVGAVYPLARINEAIEQASLGKHIRVAVKP